jgi:hypothetical protein
MKLMIMIFASAFAVTMSQAAEPELEGLSVMCQKTPGNTEAFCTCLVDSAVAGLPQGTRQLLFVEWSYPSIFNFKAPMAARELADNDEKQWGHGSAKRSPPVSSSK